VGDGAGVLVGVGVGLLVGVGVGLAVDVGRGVPSPAQPRDTQMTAIGTHAISRRV
jgi:hypothetical protein